MTPMPNAPNPNAIFGEALARTPAPLPLSTVQEQMAQTAGLNAQAQQSALDAQFKQRKLNNLKLIHDNVPDLLQASKGEWNDSVFNGLAAKGVDPDEIESLRGLHLTNDEKASQTAYRMSEVQKTQAALADHARDVAGRTAYALNHNARNPDGSYDPVKVEGVISNLEASDPQWAAAGHGQELRKLYSTNQPAFAGKMAAAEQMAPEVAKEQELLAEQRSKTAEAGSAAQIKAAQAKQAEFEQKMQEYIGRQMGIPGLPGAPTAAAAQLNSDVAGGGVPPFIADAVSREIDKNKRPEDWQEAVGAATNAWFASKGDLSKIYPEVHKIAERAAAERQAEEKAKFEATNPEIIKAKRENEIATRVGVARSMAGTGPFSSITDQGERNRAIEDSNKIDSEFADKVGASRQLRDFVAAAQSGNKAAPGFIPMAEVRQLLNRVTKPELQSVSTAAGSAWDRIQGKIGSLVEGQPIPPEILRDINTISGTMENAAGRTYDLKRQALGRNHGIAPPPRISVPETETGGPPLITTKAAFDALPRGTVYKERDGNTYTKP